MYKIYNTLFEIIEFDKKSISFFISPLNKSFQFNFGEFDNNKPLFLLEKNIDNQVIFECTLSQNCTFYVYSFSNQIFLLKEEALGNEPLTTNNIYPMSVENNRTDIIVKQHGLAQVELVETNGNRIDLIESFITQSNMNKTIHYDLNLKDNRERFILLSKVSYEKFYLIISYDDFLKEIIVKKIVFEKQLSNQNLSIELLNQNQLLIKNLFNENECIISFKKISKKSPKRILESSDVKDFKEENLISIFVIDGVSYYIFLKLNGIFIIKNNPAKATQFKKYLKSFSFGENIFIAGRLVHNAYNSFGKYDHLYAIDEENELSKFIRPFKNIKLLKQFGFFKIPLNKFDLEKQVHYPLFLGDDRFALHKLSFKNKKTPSKTFVLKKLGDKVLALRTTVYNNATYSIVPYSEMYSPLNQFKIKCAKIISKLFYKNKKQNINLFFEKQASKADESGFRVFEKVKETSGVKSKNYFILDTNAKSYPELKKKYGRDIIERFSFRHYLAIFNSDYFLSSDLSNHVINDRIYINELLEKVTKVPLIFLQHGIMFAKPVENPLGKIFYKNFSAYNIYKNVVNSKLEAEIFYKMGYDDNDLIYSGLSTFDYATLDKTSDKIVYMPTYRYWEEGLIYSGEIEKTSYFKSLIKVIKAFEKAGLRDKLMVVSHNKFAEFIYDRMEEYRDVLGPNPSEALKVGRIFISDFSSAIYDAVYRGAYPIFYWEDKDFLIEKYGAVPPVNEENAPGPVAKSLNELVELAKTAYDNKYRLENEYQEKYLKINSFNDNKNTDRIIQFLKKENIL